MQHRERRDVRYRLVPVILDQAQQLLLAALRLRRVVTGSVLFQVAHEVVHLRR